VPGRVPIIIIDGHAFNWQRICDLRRAQLEAWRADQTRQLTLFKLTPSAPPAVINAIVGALHLWGALSGRH
jgi:hypothetical protein